MADKQHVVAFDALKEWWVVSICDAVAIFGQMYGDKKGRFIDGRWIKISVMITPGRKVVPGNVIRTRNSHYPLLETLH